MSLASTMHRAWSSQALACTQRICCTGRASRKTDESSSQTTSPALTRVPSGTIEMMVGGFAGAVKIAPESGSVDRSGMWGSTT